MDMLFQVMGFTLLFHNQGQFCLSRFGAQTFPEVAYDLLLEVLATDAPAASADELLDTTPEAAKTQHPRPLLQLVAQFVPQAWKEKQFAAFARFTGQPG